MHADRDRAGLWHVAGWFLLVCLLSTISCGDTTVDDPAPTPSPVDTLVVHASNRPLRDLAQRLGGPLVTVVLLAPVGVDPAEWSPAPDQVARMQGAGLNLVDGSGYETWLDHVSLPRDRLIDTSAGFKDRLLARPSDVLSSRNSEGPSSRVGLSAPIWLDPSLAILQARAVATALVAQLPNASSVIAERLEEIEAELISLDEQLRSIADRLDGAPILFSGPPYAYLQARYGLDGHSLSWEPRREPDASEWRALDAMRVEHPAFLMLWESEPLVESRRRLAERGIESVVFDPGGGASETGEPRWIELMRSNADSFDDAVGRLVPAGE